MTYLEQGVCPNKAWYLVHCQPQKEYYAAKSLSRLLQLRVFLPESQFRLHGEMKQTPFFPGYIFVSMDLQHVSISAINTCPGVLRMINFCGSPQQVPDDVIESISQRLEQLNRLNQSAPLFAPGDTVHVKRGPLQGLDAIFVKSIAPGKRVYVLLDLLGGPRHVQLNSDALTLASAPEHSKALQEQSESYEVKKQIVRYTRGKGRKLAR